MKRKNVLIALACLLALCVSCKDEEPVINATLPGSWKGDRMEVRVSYGLVTLHEEEDDEFDAILEFREDGTVSFTRDGNTTTGTYELAGKKLTTNVDLQVEGVELTVVTFDVVELTSERLRLHLDQEQEVEVPDFGMVTTDIDGDLSFNRL